MVVSNFVVIVLYVVCPLYVYVCMCVFLYREVLCTGFEPFVPPFPSDKSDNNNNNSIVIDLRSMYLISKNGQAMV